MANEKRGGHQESNLLQICSMQCPGDPREGSCGGTKTDRTNNGLLIITSLFRLRVGSC